MISDSLLVNYIDNWDEKNKGINLTEYNLFKEIRPILYYCKNVDSVVSISDEYPLSHFILLYESFENSMKSLFSRGIIYYENEILHLNKNHEFVINYLKKEEIINEKILKLNRIINNTEKNNEQKPQYIINSNQKVNKKDDEFYLDPDFKRKLREDLQEKEEGETNSDYERRLYENEYETQSDYERRLFWDREESSDEYSDQTSDDEDQDDDDNQDDVDDGYEFKDVYQINSFTDLRIKYYISKKLDYCTCPYFNATKKECKHLKYYKDNQDELKKLKKIELVLDNTTTKEKKKEKEEKKLVYDKENIVNSYLINSFNSSIIKYNISEDLKFCSCPSFFYSTNKKCKHIEYYEKNISELNNFKKEEITLKIIS